MALNPPLAPDGNPYRVDGEMFSLTRKDLEFEIKIENQGKLTGKGFLVLTTARLVLVNTSSPHKWKAFDIPLAYLYNDKFQQPVFGSNYLEGKTTPLYNLIPGDAHFKIWFTAGGCTKFLRVFHDLVHKMRAFKSQNVTGKVNNYVSQFGNGNFQSQYVAFSESNDPSTLFVTQPPVNNQYSHMQQHFAEINMYNPSNMNNPSNMQPFNQQNNPNFNYQMQNPFPNSGNIPQNLNQPNFPNDKPPQFYDIGSNPNNVNYQNFPQNMNYQNPVQGQNYMFNQNLNMNYQPPVPNQYNSGQNPNIMNQNFAQNNPNQYLNQNFQPPVQQLKPQTQNQYPEF